ncbi:MAG: ABC transporter permease [Ferruginibacter sp.]|nr:ABC transporter permease [Ferruginibacter sp.]
MYSICIKELNRFFSNLTGYIAIILFMLVCGIFLFMLKDSSILNNNYATLSAFFELAPWVLLFLVPAITMHTLSEEFKTGTFELLKTKPLTSWQIVLGKYFAILIVLIFVIVPTFIYIVSIKNLSTQAGIDGGGIIGSYIGLFLLAAVFAAVSICCSSFTSNAVVAFLISAFVCLLLYFGFNAVSKLPFFAGGSDYYIEMLGIDFHYKSISRGVIDSRDVIYFFSIIFLSLLITVKKINKK